MRSTCRVGVLFAMLVAVALAGLAVAADGPQGVSPGAADRIAAIEGRCPSFSWELVPDATHYELVVYELAETTAIEAGVNLEDATDVLFASIPGGATAWTPEVAGCLTPGGRYAWFVRAVLDTDSGEATEWSSQRLFAVSAAPTVLEVEQALTVLLRYVEEGSQTGAPQDRALTDLARTAADKAARSVQTGTAAIRGEQPDPTGETYGVVGVSASPDGAGIGAANTSGGPDLVLDGLAHGAADTELSESGIDRPWGTAQTFDIENSMGNGMTLRVDGVDVITTATDQDVLGGLSCGSGEVAKWDGSNWSCDSDEDTLPRDPGNQLSLSGNALDVVEGSGSGLDADTVDGQDSGAFAGSVHTHAGGDITSGTVAEPRVDAAVARDAEIMPTVLANDGSGSGLDADGLDGFDSTAFSPLVHLHDDRYYTETELNTSGAGGAVHWDNLAAVPAGFADGVDDDTGYTSGPGTIIVGDEIRVNPFFFKQIETLDRAGDVGQDTSVAIGADGFALISYWDVSNLNLKVAHCDNTPCTTATVSTVDSSLSVGRYSSVAIGTDGLGLISYYDAWNGDLKVAHCADTACTTATITTLDSSGIVGQYSSVAIGGDGLGLISYRDVTLGVLRVAHCNDVACTGAAVTVLDALGLVGSHSSVAIGVDGLGLISYLDDLNTDLKVAHCNNVLCAGATLTTLDSSGSLGYYTSVTIGSDGLGLISYYDDTNFSLKVAHCDDVFCASARLSTLDTSGWTGFYTSVAVGSDGLGLISYYDNANGDLKVAHCDDLLCGGATLSTLDSADVVGPYTSIAVRGDGVAVISYYDGTNGDLKVAHLPYGW